jgi:predicted ATPase/class 3 adenylate cyclase
VVTQLPTGTVTFLFTDIEGSTKLLQELGEAYGKVQDDHMRLMRAAIAEGGGVELRTEGDAFFAVFPSAPGAVRAAASAQRSFASHDWSHGRPLRVRMGMHTGEGRLGGDDYLGIDVNRAARIAAAGHGGQVLLSEATRAVVERDVPQGVTLRDLGRHRLKDFDDPQGIHQLVIEGLPSEFPALKSLETPTNLPVEVTSFVGREREVEEVSGLLEGSRLVTLTGPGGTGKTRLAIRVAGNLADRFPDGIFFVELASVTEPNLVLGVIAAVVGTGELGPLPVMEMLQRELRHRTALLVVDNFEQVIDAAPALGSLLAGAPDIRILATSRGPLRIQGEQEYPVHPLGLPEDPQRPLPAGELTRYAAPALFVERARAIDPGFKLDDETARAVAEICRRLDGLPLAIELATSRLRLLTPAAILERLDRVLPLLAGGSRDLPARQQTLRGAIAWSYDLLSPEVAGLFRPVCAFAGGFTLEAVEPVCDPDGELGLDPLEGLEALLDAGLVRRRPLDGGEVRFETLQTVREYGLERLEEEGEAPVVRRRHAAHFLGLAEVTEPKLRGPELGGALALLAFEHDNLRAALAWAIAEDEGEIGLRMVRSLWRFWHFHGDLTAGRRWAEQVLGLPSAAGHTAVRAGGLIGAGGLAYWQKDFAAVEVAYRESLAIFRELGDAAGTAEATYNLAFIPLISGDVDRADRMFRESRAMFEELGDRRGVADSLFGLSIGSRIRGDLADARATAGESLALYREIGDPFGSIGARYALGRAASEAGDLETARVYFLETLEAAESVSDRTGIALSLDNLASQEGARGEMRRALRLGGASEAIKEAVGGEGPPELLQLPDLRAEARGLLSPEEIDAAWEEGRSMSVADALAYAREDGETQAP